MLAGLRLLPGVAAAQVSVNPGALDQMKPAAASAAPAAPAGKAVRPKAARRPERPAHAAAQSPAARRPPAKPVTVAPAPPPPVNLAPGPQAAKPPAPPPAVIAIPGATGDVAKIPGGIRLTFGAGKADLSPATQAALAALARDAKDKPAVTFNVLAYAAGVPDDPSTPRRLSLSRALAARAVLISGGIDSTRIYPRALGAGAPDGPPDRVDVTQTGLDAGVKPAP